MTVRFTKAKNEDRPPTFTCIRDDGTTTGMPSTPFFVRHDLTHYAVETVLGLNEAFYGLLAQGWEIGSFEEREPGSRKARLVPPEAHIVEHLVGTFDLQVAGVMIPDEEMVSMVREKLAEAGIELRDVSGEQIGAMRAKRAELLRRFSELAPGASMELAFPA